MVVIGTAGVICQKEAIMIKKKEKKDLPVSVSTAIVQAPLVYNKIFKRRIDCDISNFPEKIREDIRLGIFVEEQEKIFHIVFCFVITDKKTSLESQPVICVLQHRRRPEITVGEYINVWMKAIKYYIEKQYLRPKMISGKWVNVFSNGVASNKAMLPPGFNSGHYRLVFEKN